ncbi:carabin [Erpetoichthys calabaricus]|uniref:carabin n=1 Tax=Erpetoichthys calabaricus TaxID=27687 RepID=UPI002234A06E|nr:carabin [Erpetoichthys calabaricus]
MAQNSFEDNASLLSARLNSVHCEEGDSSSIGSESDFGLDRSNQLPAQETDKYGFLLSTGSAAENEGPSPEIIRQKENKWLEMMNQWDRIMQRNYGKVKSYSRKGIPASLRSRCWPMLCGAIANMEKNRGQYQELDKAPGDKHWVDIIERDIDRQFPFHEMFLSRDRHGQRDLLSVLKAYTQYRPEEGYCQGQGPVAAVLLMNMPAEQAFWCLVQISEKYLPGYYSPLLEGVHLDARVLTGLLKRNCPCAYRHLKKHGVDPLMYATEWFMCIFSRTLPFPLLLRIWDMFFSEGVTILFRVALILVRMAIGSSEKTKKCDGQLETLECLRSISQKNLREDAFVQAVGDMSLSEREVEKETAIQLEKWRKERPDLTFQPRSRLHGARSVFEEAEREEREKEKKERRGSAISLALSISSENKQRRKKSVDIRGTPEVQPTEHRDPGQPTRPESEPCASSSITNSIKVFSQPDHSVHPGTPESKDQPITEQKEKAPPVPRFPTVIPTIIVEDTSLEEEAKEKKTKKTKEQRRREKEEEKAMVKAMKERERIERERQKQLEKEEKKKKKKKEGDTIGVGEPRKKPQTRGKTFHFVRKSSTASSVFVDQPHKDPESKRNSAPYFDTYF